MSIRSKGSEWDSLDDAARANLSDPGAFFEYKGRLKKEGSTWEDDAHDILAGFIWDKLTPR